VEMKFKVIYFCIGLYFGICRTFN